MEPENVTLSTGHTQTEISNELFDHESSPKEVDSMIEPVKVEEVEEEVQKIDEPIKLAEHKVELKLGEDYLVGEDKLKEVESFAKEHKLSNEAAQKILDNQNSSIREYTDKQSKIWNETVTSWGDEIKADKDFGGEKFTETVSLAKRALATYANPEFSKILDESGYGNNPDLIKMLARIGRSISGDTMVKGQSSVPKPKSMEDYFYTNKN